MTTRTIRTFPPAHMIPGAVPRGDFGEAVRQRRELREEVARITPRGVGETPAGHAARIDRRMATLTLAERVMLEHERQTRNVHTSDYDALAWDRIAGDTYDPWRGELDALVDDGIPPPSPQVTGTRRNWYR